MPENKSKKQPSRSLWRDEMIFTIYDLAKKGMTVKVIAASLGILENTVSTWLANKPLARMAWDKGREAKASKSDTFKKYVYAQMSHDQREVWDLIEAASHTKNGFRLVDELTSKEGDKAMQMFYLQALVCSNFNNTRACAMIGITFKEVEKWREDPGFADLISQIQEHKKNFFEDAFVELAAEGNANVIIHANKTLNADRGYNEKKTIEHTGTVQHEHMHLTMNDLNLPLDVKIAIRDAIRIKKEQDEPRKALPV